MNYKVTHYPTRQRFEIELENMTAYAYAKANHLKPEGTCSYAAVWLKRHPEYLQ